MVRIPNHPLTTLPMLVTDHPLATLIISRVVRWWSALLRNGHHGGERVVSLLLLRSMIERNNSKLTTMVTMVVRGWSEAWRPRTQKRKPGPRSEGTAGGSLWWMGFEGARLVVPDARAL